MNWHLGLSSSLPPSGSLLEWFPLTVLVGGKAQQPQGSERSQVQQLQKEAGVEPRSPAFSGTLWPLGVILRAKHDSALAQKGQPTAFLSGKETVNSPLASKLQRKAEFGQSPVLRVSYLCKQAGKFLSTCRLFWSAALEQHGTATNVQGVGTAS